MANTQYFANLRTLSKMESAIKEMDIQIEELMDQDFADKELQMLFLQKKQIQRAIDVHQYNQLKKQTEKLSKSVGDGDGDGLKPAH